MEHADSTRRLGVRANADTPEDAGRARRFGTAELDAVVELPTPHVTACTFGGPDLDELYITTSAENREGDPLAGSLFRVVPGVRGRPVREFTG